MDKTDLFLDRVEDDIANEYYNLPNEEFAVEFAKRIDKKKLNIFLDVSDFIIIYDDGESLVYIIKGQNKIDVRYGKI